MAEVLADLVGRLSFEADDKGVRKFAEGVDDLGKAADDATTKGVALGTFLGNLATKALDLAGNITRAAYATGKDLVVGFAEGGAALDRMAKTTDLSVVALQRFQAAGRKAGLEPEATAKSIQVLNKNLADLALTGGGPAKDALGLLGLELEDLDVDTDERIRRIADALADVQDPTYASTLAMQLFGEEAGALAPILAQGREGLDAIGDAAEQAGLVLDENAVASAKRTKAALGDIDKTTTALGNTIAVALAPTVADLAERFGSWYRANEEVIAQRVPEVIDAIVESGAAAIDWAVEFADDVTYLGKELGHLAESIEDGLVSAYETAKPVIDAVSAVIEFQVGILLKAVELIEEVVGRLEGAREIVHEIQTGLGLEDTPTTSTRGSSHLEAENKARRKALGQAEGREGITVATMSSSELAAAAADPTLPEAMRRQAREGVKVAADREAAQNRKIMAEAAEAAARGQREALEKARRDAERDERRRKSDRYSAKLKAGSGGGSTRVDTEEAELLFGAELDALARAAGATAKARKAAIEAAAKSLEGGASESVARQAGIGQLESLSGADLSGAGSSPDAALFGLLTRIGGTDAARSAADGARFVQVHNTWNTTINFELQLPRGFGDGLQQDTEALGGSISRQITGQWQELMDRFGGGIDP